MGSDKLAKIEAHLELEKELTDLKAEMEHDRVIDELADLKAKFSAQPADIEQHVNIDLDLGSMKDDNFEFFELFLTLDWWQYLLIGLGLALAGLGSCLLC